VARGASRLMNQAHRHAQSMGPDTVKGSSRAARRAGTAAAVARLRDRHPRLTASIGERLGITDWTVSRHCGQRAARRRVVASWAAYGAVLAGAVLLDTTTRAGAGC
jgi:hypothetical protein